ncbi:MAG: response regulator transcription factor [Bacteroidales bacterium]
MKNTKHRVMVVDDHYIFRNGLIDLLEEVDQVEFVGEASSGEEFLDKVKDVKPDMVFMDIRMPGISGIEATRQAMENNPDLKIVALSMFGESDYLDEMLRAGAIGYLLKNIGREDLEKAIHNIASGKGYFSEEMLILVTRKVFVRKEEEQIQSIIDSFTKRERQVLDLVCKGFSNNEIAGQLAISPRTAGGHRNNLLSKTGLKNSASLVSFALKNKLVSL